MINVKHFLDSAEIDDGARIWVEPLGLTRDLREWCHVDLAMPELGPPQWLCQWFERHPRGYEYFRGFYHDQLSRSPYVGILMEIASACEKGNVTLLHHGDDEAHNTGTALHEFLSELSIYGPPEQ